MNFIRILLTLILLNYSGHALAVVRLLAVVDRHAPDVGEGCDLSFTDLKEFLKEARGENRRDQLQIYEYENGVVPSPGDILEYYRTAKLQPDDVLWFYYCGHGGTDPKAGPFFDMSQGMLLRSDVKAVMQSRGVQGIVLTTDNCSSPGKYDKMEPISSGGEPPIVDHWKVLSSLFANTHGTVDITAASGTKRAFVDPMAGANFTLGLHKTLMQDFARLDLDGNGSLTWTEVFADLREQTRENFRDMKISLMQASEVYLGAKETDQIPFAFELEEKAKTPVAAGIQVYHVHQIFYMTDEGYSGIRFHIKTRFGRKFIGKQITFMLTFWNEQGEQLNPPAEVTPTNTMTVDIREENLAPNDNQPWEMYVDEMAIPTEYLDNGDEKPIRVVLSVFDRSNDAKIHEQSFAKIRQLAYMPFDFE